MQPLLIRLSTVSFSDRELHDLLCCQEPTRGSLPVSELFLRATMGPGPEPLLSEPALEPVRPEGAFSPSGSLPESLLVRRLLRLSGEETWLSCPSFPSEGEKTVSEFHLFLIQT